MKKKDFKYILIGIAYFVITFFTDKNIFNFEKLNIANYICCKIIMLIILILGSLFISKVFKKDKKSIQYLKNFLIYIIPILLLLFLLWPGNWFGTDVYNFYSFTTRCDFLYYLNYLSSVFYIVGYMLFPCVSGAIILQTIIFGIVFSYIITNCYEIYNSKSVYLLAIPFFLFHTIFYTFFANRPIMYGIFYLLLISIIVIDYLKKNNELKITKLLVIAILTSIVGFWRSEAIYLFIAIPVILFVTYKISLNIKNIIKIIMIFILGYAIISMPQRMYYNKNSYEKSSRNLPMFVGGLSYMLTYDLKGDNLEKDLANIDKVLDVESMKKYASYTDTPCIWSNEKCIKSNYTDEEYSNFIKSYVNVIKNNIPVFINSKLHTFALASGINYDYFTTMNLYNEEKRTILDREDSKSIVGYKVRRKIYSVIEGKTNSKIYNKIYNLTNNLLIPLGLILIIFIYSIIKQKLLYFLLSGMLLGHSLILFITSPAAYFMYYFNVYMIGWFLGLVFILEIIKNKKLKNNRREV